MMKVRNDPFGRHGTAWISRLRAEGRSASTIDCYSRDLRDIAIILNTQDVAVLGCVDQAEIDRVAETWSSSGASPGTVARRFSALRQFSLFLSRNGDVDCCRALAVDFPAHRRPPPRHVHNDEVCDFVSLAATDMEDWMSMRDTAIFTIQADSGLTTSEAVSLDRCNVSGATIEVRETVFRKRAVGLSERGRLSLDGYLETVPFELASDGPLFVNARGSRVSVRTMQGRYRHRAATIGAGEVSGSSLRRNAGRTLALQGYAPDTIALALGLHPLSVFRFFEIEG